MSGRVPGVETENSLHGTVSSFSRGSMIHRQRDRLQEKHPTLDCEGWGDRGLPLHSSISYTVFASNGRTFGCTIIYTNTIHHAVLFTDTSSMLDTTQLIP